MTQSFMANLLGWLPSSQGAGIPARVDTDKVVPLRFFDDTPPLRASILGWTFRFDDVLDVQKLNDALTRLVNIPSWRQLGARLRLNHGKLELHIPQKFTRSRPGVRCSHNAIQMSIDDHELGQRLPKSTATPSLQVGAPDFRSFAARADAPAILQDFLNSDEPQLSMHVTTFTDATLVALSFPHTMTDVMGVANIMSAISLMLADRDGQVPSLRDPKDDPLQDVGTATDTMANEPYVLSKWTFGAIGGLRFMINYLWDKFWFPEMETRTAFLPAEFIQKLRTQAEADLLSSSSEEKPSFVSDGDILSAWATSMIQSTDPYPRPAIIMNVLNIRGRLKGVLDQAGDVFIQNLGVNSMALLSASEAASSSLGSIATGVRQALVQQTTEPQIRAIIKASRAAYASTGYAPLFGDPTARLIVISNWEKSKMFKTVDFSPAVVSPHSSRPGKLIYHHAQTLKVTMEARHFFNVIGKDLDGGYWVSGILMPQTWQKMGEAMGCVHKGEV